MWGTAYNNNKYNNNKQIMLKGRHINQVFSACSNIHFSSLTTSLESLTPLFFWCLPLFVLLLLLSTFNHQQSTVYTDKNAKNVNLNHTIYNNNGKSNIDKSFKDSETGLGVQ